MAAKLPSPLAGPFPVTGPSAGSPRARWTAWLRPLADAYLPVTRLRGRARGVDDAATMLVAGSLARVGWLVDGCFAAPPAREPLGQVPAWRLARELRRQGAGADLVVARVARLSSRALGFDDDWLAVPDWVGMRIAAPFDLPAIAQRSHSAADDLRRARRAGFAPSFSRGAADLAEFHRDFYGPFMRIRHGDEAVVRSLWRLRRRFRHGGILWIRRGEERVAGALVDLRHGVLSVLAVGVAHGSVALVRESVLAAVYAAALDHARRSGCAEVDLRGSRPSPLDGLSRYKRKWGARFYDRADVVTTTLVRWPRLTPAVAALLARMPLLYRDGDALSVLGVADRSDPASSLRALRLPELRRRILVARDPPGGPCTASGGVTVTPLDPDAGPRALVAAAGARAA